MSRFLLLVTIMMLNSIIINAETVNLYPVADTYVWEKNSTTNYGGDDVLVMGRLDGAVEFFVLWDLSSIPAGSVINSAEVRMEGGMTGAVAGYYLGAVSASWSESGVNYSNKPSSNTTIFTGVTVSYSGGVLEYEGVNIKNWVQGVLNNTINNRGLHFSVITSEGNLVQVNSREASSNNPRLRVDYTPPGPQGPDLADNGSHTFSPTSLEEGSNISVGTSVKNIGTTSSSSFNVKFYASSNNVINTTDHLLGSDSKSSLSAGSWFQANWSGALPSGVTDGSWYIGAIIDPEGVAMETNEQNNVILFSQKLTVTDPPPPDKPDLTDGGSWNLGSNTQAVGSTFSFSHYIDNIGSASAGSFTIKYYFSSNTIISSSDYYLGSESVSSLAGNSSKTVDFSGTIPTMPIGDYYLGYIIDTAGTISESNESNNIAVETSIPFSINNDHLVTATSGSNGSISPTGDRTVSYGGNITFTATADSGYVVDRWYIDGSVDQTGGNSYTISSIKDDHSVHVIFKLSPPSIPDLTDGGSSYWNLSSLLINSGDAISFGHRIDNIDDGDAGSFRIGYFLSEDQTITLSDTAIGAKDVSSLNAQSYVSVALTGSYLGLQPGNYYLGWIIDVESDISESDEANNTFVISNPITILPDGTDVGDYEVPGWNLYSQIQTANKSGLTSLNANEQAGLKDIYGNVVNNSDSKCLILIHGWMADKSLWNATLNAISNYGSLGSDWTVINYNWSDDANTGNSFPWYDQAQSAAERAYVHGLLISKQLEEQIGINNLSDVQIMAHSAGSWGAASIARYLFENNDNLNLQVTYLDPYIPDVAPTYHIFNAGYIEATKHFTRTAYADSYKAEVYWSDDPLTGGGTGNYTKPTWDWADDPLAEVWQTDSSTYGEANWDTHFGPIYFLNDSIAYPNKTEVNGLGWQNSIAYRSSNPVEQQFEISTLSSPSAGGSTRGGGFYEENSSCTVFASPKLGYQFKRWTVDGIQVSTRPDYTFTVSGDRRLVAEFIVIPDEEVFILRFLSAGYVPGGTVTVSLSASPATGTSSYAIEDTPPVGWTVSNISNGGSYDSNNNKVKFGPFFDNTARNLSYTVISPSNSSGEVSFSGIGSQDGSDTAIGGDSTIDLMTAIPADTNPMDFSVSVGEVTGYAAAWKDGTEWQNPPNPIPTAYVTRVAFLWLNGEAYEFDSSITTAPGWWVPSNPVAQNSIGIKNLESTVLASRSISGVDVSISTNPEAGSFAYAVEESIPAGLTVSGINEGGSFDSANRKVKWGPFFDHNSRTLSYSVSGAGGSYNINGIISIDGVDTAIVGDSMISVGTIPSYTIGVNTNPSGVATLIGGGSYPSGTEVNISFSNISTGYAFTGWSGDASGTSNPLTVSVDSAKSITANFQRIEYLISTSANPPAGGTVSGGASYLYGSTIQLTAAPYSDYIFTGWSGDASGNANPLSVTVDSVKSIIANFEPIQTTEYLLSVTAEPSTGGTVSGGGTYSLGTVTQITATPASGFVFTGWSGDASGNAHPLSVTVDADKSITANFQVDGGTDSPWGTLSEPVDGWQESAKYGWIYKSQEPYWQHLEHGWVVPISDGSGGVYMYDMILGTWWWTHNGLYPFMYKYAPEQGWYYYYAPYGIPGNRWFYWIDGQRDINESEFGALNPSTNVIGFESDPAGDYPDGWQVNPSWSWSGPFNRVSNSYASEGTNSLGVTNYGANVTGSFLPGSYDATNPVAQYDIYIPSSQSDGANVTYFFYGGALVVARIMDDDSGFYLGNHDDWANQISGLAFDQWHTVTLETDPVNAVYRIGHQAGGSWGNWIPYKPKEDGGWQSDISVLSVHQQGNDGVVVEAYYDNIQLTNNLGPSDFPVEGLIGYWPLEGDAIEQGGSGLDGVITGAVTDAGTKGQGLRFSGGSDNVKILGNNIIPFDAGTLSYWINPLGDVTDDIMPISSSGWSNWGSTLHHFNIFEDGRIRARDYNGSNFYSETSVQDWGDLNAWHHVVITWDTDDSVAIFLDNVSRALGGDLKRIADSSTGIMFGNNVYDVSNGGANAVNAILDEIRIYDRALSSSEISALYNDVDSGSSGSLVFSDDFEGEPLGQIPSQWVNGPWNDAGTNEVSSEFSFAGSNSFKIRSLSGGQKGVFAPGTLIEGDSRIRLWFYLPSGGALEHNFGGLDYLQTNVHFRYKGGGMAVIESSATSGAVVSNDLIATETWHQLEIMYDSQTGTFDVYINGDFSQQNTYTPISEGGWGKDFSLRGANQSGIKTVYFDNIEIYSLP